jgi:uncharacterized protein (TIGR02246 family)
MGLAAIAPALQEIHQRFQTAFNNRDLDAIVALYEPEAVFASGDGAVLHGRDDIRRSFARMFLDDVQLHLQTAGVLEGTDGIALMHSKWVLAGTTADGQPVERQGTSAEVLRRQPDGSWLYTIDNPFVECTG